MANGSGKLIIVGRTREDAAALAERLGLSTLASVSSVDEARTNGIDSSYEGLILVPGVSLVELDTLEKGFEDRPEILLNAIGEGVCLCASDGRAEWSNDRFKHFDERVRRRVEAVCRGAFAMFEDELRETPDSSRRGRRRRYNLRTKTTRRSFEVEVTPVLMPAQDGVPAALRQVAAVVRDVTSTYRMQEKIDAISRAGRELIHIEAEAIESMHVAERLALLEEKVIKFAHDLMHFDHFAIRLIDFKSGKLELVMSVGLPPDAQAIELYVGSEGQGISGFVAETGRSYICANTQSDERYITGLHKSGSSLTVPLRLFGKVLGVFNIESEEVGSFSEDDRQFAEIFATYVALAVHMLNLLVVERYTTRQSATGTVQGELNEPLDDLLVHADWLRAQAEGNEEAMAHIDRILMDVESIRKRVKEVATGPSSLLGVDEVVRKPEIDPVIRGRRILVVDNEPSILSTVRDVLQSRGANVVTCESGESAIQLLDQWARTFDATEGFALVVSDISLGDKTGYDVFASAKKAWDNIPVILMTGFGYDPHHSIVRASQEGLQCVLFKPFQVTKLLDEVRKAISSRES